MRPKSNFKSEDQNKHRQPQFCSVINNNGNGRLSNSLLRNASNYCAYDPKLFGDVVKKGFLPEERAVNCEREYRQLSYAFDTLIGPYVDKGVARKLHKRWLPPVTTPPPQ
jgi:hypothetical protein